MSRLAIILIILALGIAFLAGTKLKEADTCVSGAFVVEDSTFGGMVVLGDQQICGRGLRFGPIKGPSKES